MYGINLGYFNCIGNGSSRKVFDLGNGYVIKNATNLAGIEQNYEEYNISVFDNTGIFANVIEAYDKWPLDYRYKDLEPYIDMRILQITNP